MNRDDIHTCHPECQRPICVAVREAVAAEREWQGLTDEEIVQLMFKCEVIVTGPTQFNFARAIEAKLKEKNNRDMPSV